jgi:hypothetical protein
VDEKALHRSLLHSIRERVRWPLAQHRIRVTIIPSLARRARGITPSSARSAREGFGRALGCRRTTTS